MLTMRSRLWGGSDGELNLAISSSFEVATAACNFAWSASGFVAIEKDALILSRRMLLPPAQIR
jgi:hypothetical protein